jgi:hypothetical protein
MAGFGTMWPVLGLGNPFNTRKFRHSLFVARLKGQPQRQTPDAEPQGSGQTSGGKSAGHGKSDGLRTKARVENSGGNSNARFFVKPEWEIETANGRE